MQSPIEIYNNKTTFESLNDVTNIYNLNNDQIKKIYEPLLERLEKLKDENNKIPGGTPGYVSPEYYIGSTLSNQDARKQDFFALGSTLYYLKYGEHMLKFQKSEEKIANAFRIIEFLQNPLFRVCRLDIRCRRGGNRPHRRSRTPCTPSDVCRPWVSRRVAVWA